MPDPLEGLKNLSATVAPPLSPEEVRRRGDRMRRRRTAMQATGAAVAVVAVVSAGAFASHNLGARPQPGPAHPHRVERSEHADPPKGWTTEVPAGFRVDDGVPRPGARNGRRTLTDDDRTPWVLDPCHADAAPSRLRWDFLGLTQKTGSASYTRQLAVYGNDELASDVLASFSAELERCPNHQNYDEPGGGFSEDAWTDEDGPVIGDDSLTLVQRRMQSGTPLGPATHYTAVRVGNAVLVAAYGAGFGDARRGAVEQLDRQVRRDVSAVARRMCVFAADPCASQEHDDEAASAPAYLLDAGTLSTSTGEDDWEATPDGDGQAMLCAEESAHALPNSRTDTRYFEVVRDGKPRARAVATVLSFDLPTDAAGSYRIVQRWLRTCDDPPGRAYRILRAAGAEERVHSGRSRYGLMTWRSVLSTAPENCEDCGAAWVNHEGVTLAGGRLVLLRVAYLRGTLADRDAPADLMPGLLTAAGRLSASYS